MTDTSLITFKAISNFTNCLEEVFGEEHRFLKLYAHLINKTQIAHEKPILKHIEAFRLFCVSNRDAIEQKNYKNFEMNNITYSDRVYIDMKIIFASAEIAFISDSISFTFSPYLSIQKSTFWSETTLISISKVQSLEVIL